MKNYINRKVRIKEDVLLDEDENLYLPKNTIATIDSIECEVDGFGSDYVNITTENGDKFSGISTYDLQLLD